MNRQDLDIWHCTNISNNSKAILTLMCVIYVAAKFLFALGTKAGTDDIVNMKEVSYDQTRYCVNSLQLEHKHEYFATVTAINAALIQRNVTVHSDGGRVVLCVKLCVCLSSLLQKTFLIVLLISTLAICCLQL